MSGAGIRRDATHDNWRRKQLNTSRLAIYQGEGEREITLFKKK